MRRCSGVLTIAALLAAPTMMLTGAARASHTLGLVRENRGKTASLTVRVLGMTAPVTTITTTTAVTKAPTTVTVTAPTSVGTTAASTTATGRALAATGSAAGTIFINGARLTVIGGLLLIVTRRRPLRSH